MKYPLLLLLPLVIITALVMWSTPPKTEATTVLSPDALTISNGQFALAFVNSAEDNRGAQRIARGVATGAKLDRFPLYWDRIEPGDNQWNWSGQDNALAANEAQNLGTLAILLGTSPAHYPREVTAQSVVPMPRIGGGPTRPELAEDVNAAGGRMPNGCTVQGTPPPAGLYEPIFSDGSDVPEPSKSINGNNPWARFVENAVQRYKPGGVAGRNVRYWEIWNEPDLCHFWGGTPQDYARMLKVAYLVIKNRDPQATVVWGGMAIHGPKYENGRNFLTEFAGALRNDPMAAQYGGFFDASNQHQYSNVVHGYNYAMKIKQALAGTGWQSKPIWVTESGVPICGSFPGDICEDDDTPVCSQPGQTNCAPPYRANQVEQASYVWQNVAYTRIGRPEGPIFHFMLHDDSGNGCHLPGDGFGLYTNEPGNNCNPDPSGNAQARLSASAFRLANQYLSDVQLVWADIQGGVVRRVAFYDPATEERRLLTWAISGQDATAVIPAAGGSARRIYLDGSEVTITPSNGVYTIPVSRATNQSQPNSSTYTIGGPPYLLVERDTLPPQGEIVGLPEVTTTPFDVTWRVSDYGSPIQGGSVTIWVRANDGPWTQWRTGQSANGTATYNGEVDVRYQFGITAADMAGNATTSPTVLAETLVTDETTMMIAYGAVRDVMGRAVPYVDVSVGSMFAETNLAGHWGVAVPAGRWDIKVEGTTIIEGQNHLQQTFYDLLLPPPNNVVTNGMFEQVDGSGTIAGWSKSGSSPSSTEEQPGTRDNAVHLATSFVPGVGVPGSEGSSGGNSTISQNLTVPAGEPYLAFRWRVDTAETDGNNSLCNPGRIHDKFEVIIIAGNQPHYVHCQETGSGWGYGFIDLSDYAGQSVTLIFNLYESSPNRRTSAWVDKVMLGVPAALPEIRELYLPLVERQS